MLRRGKVDIIYSSGLERSIETAEIVRDMLQADPGTRRSKPVQFLQRHRLNERHYGALTGLDKREVVPLVMHTRMRMPRTRHACAMHRRSRRLTLPSSPPGAQLSTGSRLRSSRAARATPRSPLSRTRRGRRACLACRWPRASVTAAAASSRYGRRSCDQRCYGVARWANPNPDPNPDPNPSPNWRCYGVARWTGAVRPETASVHH